jgi:hypothetical protein
MLFDKVDYFYQRRNAPRMTDKQKQGMSEYYAGKIGVDTLVSMFPVDTRKDDAYITTEVWNAIQTADSDEINRSIHLMWLSENVIAFTDLLNELLVNPNHTQHQYVAKALQDDIKSPSSIPFIEKALATHFDYLAYTFSDSGVIAKWFSWLLFEIGTPEAVAVMQRYADDQDEGIRTEMKHRLTKVKRIK